MYEYDDTGRLVASRPESEWDAQQRGWMLALAEFRASRCPCGCGHSVADTTAKAGTHEWRVRKVRCFARDALVAAQQAAAKDAKPEDRLDARIWWTEKVR